MEEARRLKRALDALRSTGSGRSTPRMPPSPKLAATAAGAGAETEEEGYTVELLRAQLAALKQENMQLRREREQEAKSLELLKQLRETFSRLDVSYVAARWCWLSRARALQGQAGAATPSDSARRRILHRPHSPATSSSASARRPVVVQPSQRPASAGKFR